ncbi:MAG: hypothetical protein ETSY2_01200 [Candidatus Entotheonella gemina]|uniref:Uncharacterized protein n=1 Tax=Candidatus Entotheonella gemina TaxID=1429439 RepID=W4MG42_9BACT|nr:MAG: hypothetical protein ETSY2_01200 [Candidatus Entotheonella gemina]
MPVDDREMGTDWLFTLFPQRVFTGGSMKRWMVVWATLLGPKPDGVTIGL